MSDRTPAPEQLTIRPGRYHPLGVSVTPDGLQFTIFSRHATRVWLALFRDALDTAPAVEFELDPKDHVFGDIWSIVIAGLTDRYYYAYRMDGPFKPALGHRYRPGAYLLDPYATAIVGDVAGGAGKCAYHEEPLHEVDQPELRVPLQDMIIYETHVRGLTAHPSADARNPGTYSALVEKLPYLKALGVTSIELLPVHEMGEDRLGRCSIETRQELRNYWGYSSIGFFAPAARYASAGGRGEQVREFKAMVDEIHAAGMEVLLDVVYNHTSEGGAQGPLLSFRGIDNSVYYLLDERGRYLNHSGCGNTMRCGHPIVQDMILDSLRYWVMVMGVDGFRFDLAAVLNRDSRGDLCPCASLVERIAEDPILRNVKLIAEAWDVGGAYLVGAFGDHRWAEWNDQYRDQVRRYWLGHDGFKGNFASRLTGSADIYEPSGRGPQSSINYVACHDGFTMRDLVSYNAKHNLANGEDNRDGSNHNHSWNFGVEGETDDPEINTLRLRMQKNFIATLFLSLGIPMLLGGDEFARTQRGNNNAYCQDNEISWYDWGLLERHAQLHRFCTQLIQFRKDNPVFRRDAYFNGQAEPDPNKQPDILWFNASGRPQEWDEPELHLACWINGAENGGTDLYLMFNPTLTITRFYVPRGSWLKRIDTAAAPPDDIVPAGQARPTGKLPVVKVAPKSLVVLSGRW
jgi:isoamylase